MDVAQDMSAALRYSSYRIIAQYDAFIAGLNYMRVGLLLPTLNAESQLHEFLRGYEEQTLKPSRILVIDSSSKDDTKSILAAAGVAVHTINRSDFNHGGTRNLGLQLLQDCDVVVFVTQDAIMENPQALENLTRVFSDESVGAAYGRQMPREDAGLIESHARLFNYPERSVIRKKQDIPRSGFKTAFISNSFSAYRVSALQSVGGFPTDVILGEDFYVAAKLIESDWGIAYVADACVKHSHSYRVIQEAKRYFDIGVFHARNRWLFELLGRTGGEGLRFVRSELNFLMRRNPLLIPEAILRTGMKYLFYRLGLVEDLLPLSIKKHLSMHRYHWM